MHTIAVDDERKRKYRSSGVLVSTGSGSTAWMRNAVNLTPAQIDMVLRETGRVVGRDEVCGSKILIKGLDLLCPLDTLT